MAEHEDRDQDDFAASVAKMSLKMYDDLASVRAFLAEHPECKDEIVNALATGLNAIFAPDFYGRTGAGPERGGVTVRGLSGMSPFADPAPVAPVTPDRKKTEKPAAGELELANIIR
jgi:hypothetical protein